MREQAFYVAKPAFGCDVLFVELSCPTKKSPGLEPVDSCHSFNGVTRARPCLFCLCEFVHCPHGHVQGLLSACPVLTPPGLRHHSMVWLHVTLSRRIDSGASPRGIQQCSKAMPKSIITLLGDYKHSMADAKIDLR